jgi:hypothetical protein
LKPDRSNRAKLVFKHLSRNTAVAILSSLASLAPGCNVYALSNLKDGRSKNGRKHDFDSITPSARFDNLNLQPVGTPFSFAKRRSPWSVAAKLIQ